MVSEVSLARRSMEGLDDTEGLRVRRHLRCGSGSGLTLFGNKSGHSFCYGVSDVTRFVHHALRIVIGLASRDSPRLLPLQPKLERALKDGGVFVARMSVTPSSGARRELDGNEDGFFRAVAAHRRTQQRLRRNAACLCSGSRRNAYERGRGDGGCKKDDCCAHVCLALGERNRLKR